MNAVVFLGPTLVEQDITPYANLEFRPPVRQGDLYAATLSHPRAIGIIDGYFDGHPAVLHKEILWALTRGIAVFGASSMGALRAAELHPFGMRGVGRIFEAYRDGELTDDDEVALIHGPPETGYVHLSEPMVNIRATLESAVRERVLDEATGAHLEAVAKKWFYQARNWPDLISEIGDAQRAERLSSWLKAGKVDRKRLDGLELLAQLDAFVRGGARPEPPTFHFEWTENWHNAPWRDGTLRDDEKTNVQEEGILDELRLWGDYAQLRRDALLRLLARSEGDSTPDRQAVRRVTDEFRSQRGLMQQTDLIGWARENGTDLDGFERLLADEARVETLARDRDAELHRGILDRLRVLDLYGGYREKALARLQSVSTSAPLPRVLLSTWYFEKRLGRPVPDDLSDHARSIGLASLDKFYELLAREYTFATTQASSDDTGAKDERPLT